MFMLSFAVIFDSSILSQIFDKDRKGTFLALNVLSTVTTKEILLRVSSVEDFSSMEKQDNQHISRILSKFPLLWRGLG